MKENSTEKIKVRESKIGSNEIDLKGKNEKDLAKIYPI